MSRPVHALVSMAGGTGLVIVQRPDLREANGRIRPGDVRRVHPDRIVIHRNTASEKWYEKHPQERDSVLAVEALRNFHAEPGPWSFRLFPYHYFVDRDASVFQVHDEMTVTPHARNVGNYRAIGVTLNVDGRTESPSKEVVEAVSELCAQILQRWPGCRIVGHSEGKRCPGPLVPVRDIELSARRLAGLSDQS